MHTQNPLEVIRRNNQKMQKSRSVEKCLHVRIQNVKNAFTATGPDVLAAANLISPNRPTMKYPQVSVVE
jgi:predicted adenine nucleotide alpha hydrolase (AANH) superfamily ATPase